MRLRLLATAAATAVILSTPAWADDTKIEKPPHEKETPDDREPHEFDVEKALGVLTDLFDNAAGVFTQQGRMEQTGDANTATIDQTGSGNGLAHVRQVGDRNMAEVTQLDSNGDTSFDTPSNTAVIGQIGNDNIVTTRQESSLTGNRIDVHQDGDLNTVVADQIETSNSSIQIIQGTETDDAFSNTVNATQALGDLLIARIQQTGTANMATTNQTGGMENTIVLLQDGNDNVATVMQTDVTGSFADV